MTESDFSRPLRVVFAGTPEFAVPCLRACLEVARADPAIELVAVYTQPDRPSGRGRQLVPGPIKQTALAAGLPVEQPLTLKDPAAQARLAELAPDLLVVVAYGLILPRKVLALPRYGGWNVHASLLPRWRGAAPIQRAILAGDTRTGVGLMQMQTGLDTGPVLAQLTTPIQDSDDAGTLHDRLAVLGAALLGEYLPRLRAGTLPAARAQAESGIEYAHKLDKREAQLDWNQPAPTLARQVRGFNPWPVAEATIAGERLRIWAAAVVSESLDGAVAPGTLVAASRAGLDIATGAGVLRVTELQRAGGRRIQAADYLNARVELRRLVAGSPPA